MQKRAFGLEVEYSVACRDWDGSFCTEFSPNPQSTEHPAIFLLKTLPLPDSAPENLKSLIWYPKTKTSHYWLGSNGARLYFDNSSKFPEYATPECSNPREAVIHSLAGDGIMEDLRQETLRQNILTTLYGGRFTDISVFKMNAHFAKTEAGQKATGCHENYLTLNEFTKEKITDVGLGTDEFCDFLVPFLMSRQIFDGAGGIYWSKEDGWQYVISQRAFFIDFKTSSLTTDHGRGFVHFRTSKTDNFPPGLTRLHLHCGDINMSPFGKHIAMGATHLVLRALEEGKKSNCKYRPNYGLFIYDFWKISADPELKTKIRLTDISGLKEYKFSALELQKIYIDYVTGSIQDFSEEEKVLLKCWIDMVEKLEKNPLDASRELDWLIKLAYLNEKFGNDFENKQARYASALYHDISPRGLYNILLRCGRADSFTEPEEIVKARFNPPQTRAEFRSRHIKAISNLTTNESLTAFTGWGTFSGIDNPISIPHPLDRTSEKGEAALKYLEKLASRKNSNRA